MITIIMNSILMMNAIFWGIYPPSENSPHNKLMKYIGLNIKFDSLEHLITGLFFYVLAFGVSHWAFFKN